jgi:hypothetical protein
VVAEIDIPLLRKDQCGKLSFKNESGTSWSSENEDFALQKLDYGSQSAALGDDASFFPWVQDFKSTNGGFMFMCMFLFVS